MFRKIFLALLALSFAFIAYLFVQAGNSEGKATATIGLTQITTATMPDSLKPCPDTPNCVSTFATDDKQRQPITYTGGKEEAKNKLLEVLDGMKRTELQSNEENYVHYTFKTWPIPFTDDVEFLFDDEKKLINYRSASRVGRSDLGVNSKRMAKIVEAFAQK